jgi:3-isopropylmalate/(R)-2-methylmalate dehydratase small subunit
MSLDRIGLVRGLGVHLPGEDVDTDRIVPARFLRSVTFDDLGQHAFEDARVEARQRGLLHPFDDARFDGASCLVVGRNFGCGSSREHAARALSRRGIRTIIGESFGDIFFGNATALGMPCVAMARVDLDVLAARISAWPATLVEVDLSACEVRANGARFPLSIPTATRRALLDGAWDPIAELLARDNAIPTTVARLAYLHWAGDSAVEVRRDDGLHSR